MKPRPFSSRFGVSLSLRSLFLKIFLWFWSAMALTVIAFATVVANTQPQDDVESVWVAPEPPPNGPDEPQNALDDHHRPRPERPFGLDRRGGPRETVQIAAAVMESGGFEAAKHYLSRLEQTSPARAYIFDQNGGHEVRRPTSNWPPGFNSGRIKARLSELARRAGQSGALETTPPGPIIMAAQRASAGQNAAYIVAIAWPSDHDRPPRGGPGRILDWLLFAPLQTQLLRLAAALLTTGLVCLVLARHLTAPLSHLRGAAQRLAAGDLKSRVGNNLPARGDEIGMLARDFDAMAERLESLVSAQNRLVADVSHELRSPLARLSVALGLVRETAGPAASDDLDRIEREAERLNALIGQLLTLSRLESGEQKPAHESVDLTILVEEICADAQFEARGRGCGVHLSAQNAIWATGTESLLRSALENVVRNATRYTRRETDVEVTLEKSPDTQTAILRVRDFGPGVPDAALPHLFRPFYRVEGARDRQSGGAGLGLAITEAAIGLHGGQVRAFNAQNGGLIVEIQLPIAADE